jgi:D-3-phosphoglycerate dehydrogenase
MALFLALSRGKPALLLPRPASNATTTATFRLALSSRFLSSSGVSDAEWEGPIPLDVEHYTSGWNVTDVEDFIKPGKYCVQTFNKISPVGLARFPEKFYSVDARENATGPAHAVLLRSHKLQESEVDVSVRAIARCGAGTNNIPVSRMTELGIPVFNTPGANANAVKELIICGMLLASRRIVDGINHMKRLGEQGLAKERVEKDKAMFGGRELSGKTLAVIGLGTTGWLLSEVCLECARTMLLTRLPSSRIGSHIQVISEPPRLGMPLRWG